MTKEEGSDGDSISEESICIARVCTIHMCA